ncbi:MAG: sensor histidine kinase [Tatlockia sp.]|nr:sensor histidine kinase [Tatlockia sp.]
MFHATRRRLAIWYTTVTAVLLLVFASGVYFYVRSTLIERVDDTLLHVVEIVERNLVIEPYYPDVKKLHVNVEASFRNNADTVEDDRIDLEWFNSTGELLWSTFSEPLNIPIHFNSTGETVQVLKPAEDNNNSRNYSPLLLRQVTQRMQVGPEVLGYLRVSHPWFEVTKPVQQLAIDLSVGTGLMVFSVALCGWFLAGKAMEPVLLSYQRLKQFTADASHELRSPITLIQTNIQVALAEPELSNSSNSTSLQYSQNLKVLERLTKRLGRLVDDLLFLARQDSGLVQPQFDTCPLDALLVEVVEEQQLLAKEKNITLSLELIEPLTTVPTPEQLDSWFALSGDWDQLARLFTNLIENAINYSSPGDRVQLQLQRITTTSELPPLAMPPGAMQVKIIDQGVGIASADLPRLFDRFYRVDPARSHTNCSGSGLGLAISSAIVLNHFGQIKATSVLHQGTTFIVTLPILLEPA